MSANSSAMLLAAGAGSSSAPDTSQLQRPPQFKSYRRRWLMLAIFSSLALCNNLACYTFAPVSLFAEASYGGAFNSDVMVTIFFITYVIFSFPSSNLVDKYGLRAGVVVGAWLQAIGCLFRCLQFKGDAITPTAMAVIGQIIASLGQAFFVNPPPQVASTWFDDEERATATSIACNANSLGIAAAYVLAPAIARDASSVNALAQTVAAISICLAVVATVAFSERPPLPPSYSAFLRDLERETNEHTVRTAAHQLMHERSVRRQETLRRFTLAGDEAGPAAQATPAASAAPSVATHDEIELAEPEIIDASAEALILAEATKKTWGMVVELFRQPGFWQTAVAFAVAEGVVNAFSTFMPDMLMPSGFTNSFSSWMGFAFIISALVGSAVASYVVDRFKKFQLTMNVCFLTSLAFLVFFNLLITSSTASNGMTGWVVIAVLLVGFCVGPLQPVAVEVAAECTYPAAETFSTGVLQVLGNLLSAILVPIMTAAKDAQTRAMFKSNWILIVITGVAGLVYTRFSGTYRRLEADLQDAARRGDSGAAVRLEAMKSAHASASHSSATDSV